MCFSVWQPDGKAGGRGSREEGRDSLRLGSGVRPALSISYQIQQKPALFSDGNHPSPTFPFLVPLRKAVDEEVSTCQAAAVGVMASWLDSKV